MTALATGVLVGSSAVGGGCLWLKPLRHAGRRQEPVVWPSGFHARFSPVELINANGQVIARAGDYLTFGGGLGPASESGRCMFGERNAFIVQSAITVRHHSPAGS